MYEATRPEFQQLRLRASGVPAPVEPILCSLRCSKGSKASTIASDTRQGVAYPIRFPGTQALHNGPSVREYRPVAMLAIACVRMPTAENRYLASRTCPRDSTENASVSACPACRLQRTCKTWRGGGQASYASCSPRSKASTSADRPGAWAL